MKTFETRWFVLDIAWAPKDDPTWWIKSNGIAQHTIIGLFRDTAENGDRPWLYKLTVLRLKILFGHKTTKNLEGAA